MAYGNVLGYEPAAQPGAYNFKTAAGPSILLSGAPAENLKARLDASAALAGQKVAGPGGGSPADMSPAPIMSVEPPQMDMAPPATAPAMSVAPPQAAPAMSVAPPPGPAPMSEVGPRVELAAGSEGGPAQTVGAPPVQSAPTRPSSQPFVVNGINTGYTQGPDGRLYKQVAGSPGVSKDQLLSKATQGVAMPHSMSESTTGGFAPSQEFLDERHKLAEEKGAIIDKTAAVEAQNAARESELAKQQFASASALQQDEQQRADAVQARFQKDLETKDRLQKEYGSARVNPQRLFSGVGGGFRAVGAVLASGLGAAGSGLMAMGGHPGQPNLGMQAVNMAIDRDIAAQENEIKVKGAMADNALAQFQRTGLNLDQARAALKSAQLGWAQAQVAQNAATTKGSMVEVNAQNLHNALGSAINDADEQYRQHSLGTATKSVAEQVVYPHAGSRGGMVALAPGETMGAIKSGQEIESKTADTAKTMAEAQKTAGEVGKSSKPKTQGEQNVEGAIATTENSLKRLGAYKPDEVPDLPENQGLVRRAWNGAEDLVMGAGNNARTDMTAHERQLIQDTEAARGEIKSLTSVLSGQGALSGPESAAADKGLAPGATVGDIQSSLAMLRERAQKVKEATAR